jgi:FKBP-type peptidyl-prolyl cis-trans isomerase
MRVGGRRQMVIPAVDAFGATGNVELGVPADTDLVLVIDLIAAF